MKIEVKVEVEKKKGKLLGAGLPREMRCLPCEIVAEPLLRSSI